MDLKKIVDDYVESVITFEQAKGKDSKIAIQVFENEKRKLYDLYINKLYQIDNNELRELKLYLTNLINELHNHIFEYEIYRNNIFNHVVNGEDMYIDKLNSANLVLDNLVHKTKIYENIVFGLKDLIKTKSYMLKR